MADPFVQTKNYGEQGGANTVIGGTLTVVSGGKINIESGGVLEVDGNEFSTAELAALEGVTAGTVSASKAIIVGANKNIDTIAIADLKLGAGAGTSVTATAAQLNAAGANTGTIKSGNYTVVEADDTAGTVTIATGLASIVYRHVDIERAGVYIFSDQAVSHSNGNIVVADGGATYALTPGDVIYWTATGAMA